MVHPVDFAKASDAVARLQASRKSGTPLRNAVDLGKRCFYGAVLRVISARSTRNRVRVRSCTHEPSSLCLLLGGVVLVKGYLDTTHEILVVILERYNPRSCSPDFDMSAMASNVSVFAYFAQCLNRHEGSHQRLLSWCSCSHRARVCTSQPILMVSHEFA